MTMLTGANHAIFHTPTDVKPRTSRGQKTKFYVDHYTDPMKLDEYLVGLWINWRTRLRPSYSREFCYPTVETGTQRYVSDTLAVVSRLDFKHAHSYLVNNDLVHSRWQDQFFQLSTAQISLLSGLGTSADTTHMPTQTPVLPSLKE